MPVWYSGAIRWVCMVHLPNMHLAIRDSAISYAGQIMIVILQYHSWIPASHFWENILCHSSDCWHAFPGTVVKGQGANKKIHLCIKFNNVNHQLLRCVTIVIQNLPAWMTKSWAGFWISSLAKLLKLLDSETEGSAFSTGLVRNDKLCIFVIVTQPVCWCG